MAILKIARLGHPVLLQRAEAVADPTAPEMRRLVADMVETLEDIGGLGLAAPQIHVSLRLFIWRTAAGGHSALFNPEIQPLGEDIEEAWEGCLSIPGQYAEVKRPAQVRVTYLDYNGNPAELLTDDPLMAHCVQHEVDHLNGVLFIDHLSRLKRESAIRKVKKAQRENR